MIIAKDDRIEELDLPKRVWYCLKRRGIDTVGDLQDKTEMDLLEFPMLGQTSLRDIRIALQRKGLPALRVEPARVCPHCGGEL